MSRSSLSTLAALALLSATAACAPTIDRHGFVADSKEAMDVKAGVDTKATVLARLGTPSTTGSFDEESWYYLSMAQSRIAFFDPKTTERSILAIRFSADDVVSKVETFGLEKGRVVAYNDQKTPTRGRELGFVEQIFGNIGRTPTTLADPEQDRNRRGR
ncbi:MAG: outer membrane protein assembly factor BamE [Alphaproteobacteria bacterium]|jgi:outer membrane protein assembly factor BamE (lipoprotein component of BamABCDE complex)|nr:outer membrane protein assembly factor BamE [Alphaproteobacteria bacterium]